MSGVPDLPMRERIAEAICNVDHGEGEWEFAEPLLRELELRRADAVLAVLADLPDTAVEAGVKAGRAHDWTAVHLAGGASECSCGKRFPTFKAWAAHNNSERWAATIAAIKEGKA